MDGLLIDSEDLYTICTNKVLERYNKPDMPWSVKAQLQGRPGPEAGRIFREWAQLPCTEEEYMAQNAEFQRQYFPTAKPLPGVPELLQRLKDAGVGIALATSSNRTNFALKTDHLQDLFKVFPKENQILGDDERVPKGRGKPAPDIYLLALKTLNQSREDRGEKGDIKPSECLVFEDSVPGVESGRRAGAQVIWCPHPGLLKEYHGREKEVLAGQTGEYKGDIQPVEELNSAHVPGTPGKIDDGWAVFVRSLEDFPYKRYGLEAPSN
ncbi:MAG: hypothetical protein Q9162_005798 [Coniocarpon cinnabarinum]